MFKNIFIHFIFQKLKIDKIETAKPIEKIG